MTDLRWNCGHCGARLRQEFQPLVTLVCEHCGERFEHDDRCVWQFAAGFVPPGFASSRRDHLADIETDHFWFPPRSRLLATLLDRYAPRRDSAIDLGCGNGRFLSALEARFRMVVGVDAYSESLGTARERSRRAVLVQADASRVPLDGGQFDLVASLDVLEHVEPGAFLREAARLAGPHGRLLVSVPAYPALWSPLDEAAGHRCRYRTGMLRDELAACGWRIVHRTHYQALLFPLLWLLRRLSTGGLRRAERYPPAVVGSLLGTVNALEVRLLGGRQLPWGSSLIVIAERVSGENR